MATGKSRGRAPGRAGSGKREPRRPTLSDLREWIDRYNDERSPEAHLRRWAEAAQLLLRNAGLPDELGGYDAAGVRLGDADFWFSPEELAKAHRQVPPRRARMTKAQREKERRFRQRGGARTLEQLVLERGHPLSSRESLAANLLRACDVAGTAKDERTRMSWYARAAELVQQINLGQDALLGRERGSNIRRSAQLGADAVRDRALEQDKRSRWPLFWRVMDDSPGLAPGQIVYRASMLPGAPSRSTLQRAWERFEAEGRPRPGGR